MNTTALVKCSDAYIAVFDDGSACNRAGHFKESWDKAWDFEKNSPGAFKGATGPGDLEQAGDRFSQYWNHRMSEGEILVWNPGSGVYRVEVRLLAAKPRRKLSEEKLLACPTGKLLIAGLDELGGRITAAATVPPGRYRAGLEIRESEHKKHWLLKDSSEYPPQDGPDFIVTLQAA